jgi:CubicO group peptidase (beta-lactamase class C family)
MLADDGVIAWDDPLSKHFSGFKLSDPNANALLTVRDLLCHRCGLGGHDLLWYRAPWGIDETIRRAQLLPLDYPFRGGFRYSSIPLLVAGWAIEKRTEAKWEKLVKTRICAPLGMTGVTFTTAVPTATDRAEGYKICKSGRAEPMPRYEITEPNPSGSVNATPRDLAAWLKFHLSEGVGPEGTRLVSVKNLRETHTAQNLIPMHGAARDLNPQTVQLAYAMGWIVYDYRGKKVVSHGGMIDGFRVQLTFMPDDNLGFAVMCNLHDTRMTLALTNTLIDLYCGLEAKDWDGFFRKIVADEAAERKRSLAARDQARDRTSKPSLSMAKYAGIYSQPAYGDVRVMESQGRLTLVYGNFTCPLEHFEADTFRITSGFFEEHLVRVAVKEGVATELTFEKQQFQRK